MNSVGQTTPKTYIICPCLKTWFKIKLEFEFKFKFEFEQKKENERKRNKELACPFGPDSGARGPAASPRPSCLEPTPQRRKRKKKEKKKKTWTSCTRPNNGLLSPARTSPG